MKAHLLDTHALLWWLSSPKRLSAPARRVLERKSNRVFVSAAAVWEMAIKRTLGRLDYPSNLGEVLRDEAIDVLDVGLPHALAVADLPLLHSDPFDRMQVAQARVEGLVLVTRDPQITAYDVEVLTA